MSRPTEQAVAGPRLDLYRPIHKALRVAMFDTLRRLGAMDVDDPEELEGSLGQAEQLLALLAGHLKHENDFLHTAIEARRPCSAQRSADEHRDHLESIGTLTDELAALRQAPAAERARLAHRLYQHLGLFVAENLEHMQFEETQNNAALWALYSDAELAALHGRLSASIEPRELMQALGWMAHALNAAELAGLFHGMRAKAPPEAFDAALAAARARLDDTRWARLARSLGLAPVPGLAA
ncbi:hypothetical protein [Ideonella sp.]|uniref:hemerythrin domain-containing protein n=1 Tax=Ideonella sp. TaxID=1929293 RepID=UPI002B4A7DCC|nr:hypothetical protein [Ideonella sp.]HJV69946.1 hypothetical protein [Ideonella sp.]